MNRDFFMNIVIVLLILALILGISNEVKYLPNLCS